jgi:hypothetical protein
MRTVVRSVKEMAIWVPIPRSLSRLPRSRFRYDQVIELLR